MKKIIAVGLAVVMLGGSCMSVSAAGCGDWDVDATGTAYCDADDGCGLFWAKPTHKVKMRLKRRCVNNDNTVYTEYKAQVVKLGCCE